MVHDFCIIKKTIRLLFVSSNVFFIIFVADILIYACVCSTIYVGKKDYLLLSAEKDEVYLFLSSKELTVNDVKSGFLLSR